MNLKSINNKVILKENSAHVEIVGIVENNTMLIKISLSNKDIAQELIDLIRELNIGYKLYIANFSSKSAKKVLNSNGIVFEEYSDYDFLNNIFAIK